MNLYNIKLTKRYRISRFAEMIQYFQKNQILITTPPDGTKIAYEHVQNILDIINGNKNIRIFTDGSTLPGNQRQHYSFAVTSNGYNFHVELVGITIAAWTERKANSWEDLT